MEIPNGRYRLSDWAVFYRLLDLLCAEAAVLLILLAETAYTELRRGA